MRAIFYTCAGLALLMTNMAIGAQQLRDPTRPPDGVYKKGSASAAGKSQARSSMVLQTVLIAEDRQVAVISGGLVSVGDTVSGFRLTEIREAEVDLKGKGGTRTLRLYPGVHISDSRIATRSEQKNEQQ